MPHLFPEAGARIVIVIVITWSSGKLLRQFGMSEIIANVATGVIFGPVGLWPIIKDHGELKVLQFIGVWGVALLLFGSGVESNFSNLRAVGAKAVGVGAAGTLGPFLLGFLLSLMFAEGGEGRDKWKAAFSMGTVLAPTSIAVPLSVFMTYRYVTKPVGQVVLNAAVLDDIFSIVLLSILQSLTKEGGNLFQDISLKILWNALMISFAILIGCFVMPSFGLRFFHFLSDSFGEVNRDVLQTMFIFATMLLVSFIASLFECDLLGPFCSGLLFCELPRSETLWNHQTKRVVKWMIRIFFTFNVGCDIQAQDLFLWEALWKGIVIFLIPGLGGKLLCGFFHMEEFLMTGIAMSGRGEFAFVVLHTSKAFLSPATSAALVWALLLTMLVCPLALSLLIQKQIRSRTGIQNLTLEINTTRKCDLALQINEFMHEEDFTIRKIRYDTSATGRTTKMKYCIFAENCINEAEVEELKDRLKALLDDDECSLKVDYEENFCADCEESEQVVHSFLLKWTLPKVESNIEAETKSDSKRTTPWVLLNNINRELERHNLVMNRVEVPKIISLSKQIQFEATLYVQIAEGRSLKTGTRSFTEDRSLQDLERADPVSKMGMHVMKKILHAYHVSGVTDFNQDRKSSVQGISMSSLNWTV